MKQKPTWIIMGACTALWAALVVAQTAGPPDVSRVEQTLAASQSAYRARTGDYAQVALPYAPGAAAVAALVADGHYPLYAYSPVATPIPEFSWYTDGITITMNVYESPEGFGYEIVYDNGLWRRIAVAGPETWRAEDWRQLSPLPTPPISPLSPLEAP